VAPLMGGREVVVANGRRILTGVDGITPQWGEVRGRRAEIGRYVVERDVEATALVAVIGKQLKEEIFGGEEALGRDLTIRGVRFRVVGILPALGNRQVDSER